MNKRRFFKGICSGAVAFAVGSKLDHLKAQPVPHRKFNPVLLRDELGHNIRADALEIGSAYLFYYPYVTTPCFLIDLGEPIQKKEKLFTANGTAYEWPGGIGPKQSIVAFSAICAHKLSHPTKHVSFINYRHSQTTFSDHNKQEMRQDKVIQCCSERSVYDARHGGEVLGGPAPQALAAIALDYNTADNTISATGSFGGDMYDKFLQTFGFRLALEFGLEKPDALATESTIVTRADQYSEQKVSC